MLPRGDTIVVPVPVDTRQIQVYSEGKCSVGSECLRAMTGKQDSWGSRTPPSRQEVAPICLHPGQVALTAPSPGISASCPGCRDLCPREMTPEGCVHHILPLMGASCTRGSHAALLLACNGPHYLIGPLLHWVSCQWLRAFTLYLLELDSPCWRVDLPSAQ